MAKTKEPNKLNLDLETLNHVSGLIKTYLENIEKMKLEVAKHKEMIQDALDNNPQYREAESEAKEASKIKADAKRQIMEENKLDNSANKIKELNLSLKQSRAALSEYLVEYARLSNSKQFELGDGKTMEIIYTAHLAKTLS